MSEEKIKINYIERIDVFRFVAAMMVVVYHAYERWIGIWGFNNILTTDEDSKKLTKIGSWINTGILNGGFGVDVFFLISGFLITYLLLIERESYGKINIPKFYVRRAFRIWPLYYLVLILSPILISWLGKEGSPNYLSNALFYNNFDTIKTHFWIYPTAHFWSLCVEEHFYLVWPFIIAFVPIKNMLKVMTLLFCMSIFYRAYLVLFTEEPWYNLYLNTLSRYDVLALGAIVAFKHWQSPIKINTSRLTRLMIYAVFIIVFCNDNIMAFDNLFLALIKKYFYVGIAGFAMINFLFNDKPLFNWANNKIFRYFGKVSYGIYLIGLVLLDIIIEKIMFPYNFSNPLIYWLLVLSLTIGVPIVIYEIYEKWFLKLKKNFEMLRVANKK